MKKQFTKLLSYKTRITRTIKKAFIAGWLLIFIIEFCPTNLIAQPTKEWDKTIGGNDYDIFRSLDQTSDGGYIVGGYSHSNASRHKSEDAKGGFADYWVVKLNATGTKDWDKTIGGSDSDILMSLQQTADGGYILGGYSSSNASGDKSQNSKGSNDFWVVKLSAAGVIQWEKTLGGAGDDQLSSLQQTTDGGYILGGSSTSNASGDKSENSNGGNDFWVVKLSASGIKEWDKTFGGMADDNLYSLQQTSDGGYILGGSSSGIDSAGDYWVVKLNPFGIKQWDKTLGGSGTDRLHSLQQTVHGGYILGGYSVSNAGRDKSQNAVGREDYWLVKLNDAGNKEWDKTFGGNNSDFLQSIRQTADNGYILGGYSSSDASGNKSENSKGPGADTDFWVVKVDTIGNLVWDKTIGGNGNDGLFSLQQAANGSYILGGISTSNISGDKSENSTTGFDTDYWVVKLQGDATGICDIALTSKVTQAEPWYGMFGPTSGAGAIDVTVSGGTAPFTYAWTNGTTTEDVAVAAPGLYTVTVTDARGCTARTSVTVSKKNGPMSLMASHIDVSTTNGQNGSIDLTVVGGTGAFKYRWSTGATTEDLTGLAAGVYTVTVTDAFGRTATTSVTVTQPVIPVVVCDIAATSKITQAEPWYGMYGPANGAGAIDLTISGGTAPYTYLWNNDTTTEDITIAAPGLYSVIVTDAKGCTARTSVTVSKKNGPMSLMASHIDVSTTNGQNGSIDLTVVGGTGAFKYRWSTGATTEDLTGLAAGVYTITVTDAFGRTATISVQVLAPGTMALASAKKPTINEVYSGQENGFTIYPNPVVDQTTIAFTLAETTSYQLDLYDIKGAKVRTIAAGTKDNHQSVNLKVNVASYAKGIYLVKLVTDKGVSSRRLVIE